MYKSSFFSGQPVFTQLFSLIPSKILAKCVRQQGSDHYYKKFDTRHHLITMLYASYQHCTSLREVVTGMKACQGRLQSLGMKHLPTRSTLSDANKNRGYKVFEQLFLELLEQYRTVFPDSRSKDTYFNKLIIIDSTTITLFKEILKGAGTKDKNGKRKGGMKVHMAVQAKEDLPYLIKFTSAATPDKVFMQELSPPASSIIVMDKGYNSYDHYNRWKASGVDWVTRINKAAVWTMDRELALTEEDLMGGVISDRLITMGHAGKRDHQKVQCRMVSYTDPVSKKTFEFIASNMDWPAIRVADIYSRRWQIELLFRRIKQNMPLHYFLGDNENAIKIQIYCALISDLLLKITLNAVKRKWSFSNMASLVRLHLVNYTNLVKFMEKPDQCAIYNPVPKSSGQLNLFSRYG